MEQTRLFYENALISEHIFFVHLCETHERLCVRLLSSASFNSRSFPATKDDVHVLWPSPWPYSLYTNLKHKAMFCPICECSLYTYHSLMSISSRFLLLLLPLAPFFRAPLKGCPEPAAPNRAAFGSWQNVFVSSTL